MIAPIILSIVIFCAIKLIFYTLLTRKIGWRYLKNFAIANFSSLTVSILIFFLLFRLKIATGLRFNASQWGIIVAFAALVIIESIFYCKFEKVRKKYEIALIVFAVNLFAVLLSTPLALNTSHRPDKYTFRISCTSRLKQIGLALKQYAMDNDGWLPDKSGAEGLEMLRSNKYLTDYRAYVCPAKRKIEGKEGQSLSESNVGYIYCGRLKFNAKDAKTPVVWDKATNHEKYGNVLFLDGHVQGFKGENWMEQAFVMKSFTNKYLATASRRDISIRLSNDQKTLLMKVKNTGNTLNAVPTHTLLKDFIFFVSDGKKNYNSLLNAEKLKPSISGILNFISPGQSVSINITMDDVQKMLGKDFIPGHKYSLYILYKPLDIKTSVINFSYTGKKPEK